jgi:hypothetical protein
VIALGNSYVGSMVQADARRGYPSRYIRLVLGETGRWRSGQYEDGEQTVHLMTAATARKLAKELVAEARIVEARGK